MAKDYSNRQTTKQYLDQRVEFDGRLEDFVAELQEYLERYPTSVIKVESDYLHDGGYNDGGYTLSIYIERLENDEEHAARIQKEALRKAQDEERERKQLEALKKKYG